MANGERKTLTQDKINESADSQAPAPSVSNPDGVVQISAEDRVGPRKYGLATISDGVSDNE